MPNSFNLATNRRAERKLLITCVEWNELVGTTPTQVREIVGKRITESSIEYNPDIVTENDILGNTYTDVNKTQPEQSLDPFTIIGGSKLAELLNDIRKRNALAELNQFTVYVITAFVGNSSTGYDAEKHVDCTITYDSFGGEDNVDFPITIHLSNNITTGTVNKLTSDFEFSADVSTT